MNSVLPGALALALALCGCAAGRVSAPPPPPAFDPGAKSAPAPAPIEALPGPAEAAGLQTPPAAPAPAPERAPTAEAPDAPRVPSKERPPLGWIAGEPLSAEELLVEWGDVASRELYLVLDKLVAARLALAEAGRLEIRLDPEAVEARFAAEREKLAKRVAREGKARSLEDFIADELGFEPARYLDRVRRATIRQMLAERAVRATSLTTESVAVRLIVVQSPEEVEAVRTALAGGQDFAEVARTHSVDDTKERGGLVPFVVAQERSPLARLAFQTPVGEVAGPMPVADHQFWIRVEERRTPVEGTWTSLESPVEASLERFPVTDTEFVAWKIAMEGRYPIDLGPLWSLIGASR